MGGLHTRPALIDASVPREGVQYVDVLLLDRLRAAAPESLHVAREVSRAGRLLHASHGRMPVATVAEEVGCSRRHLSERFRLALGLTPEEAARIARFERARTLLLSGRFPRLADVADLSGYADQQHLAREWRALAGCSVTTWLREELPFVHDGTGAATAISPA